MTYIHDQNGSRAGVWATRVLSTLVSVAFLGSGIAKLAHVPKVIEQLTHAGIPEAAIVPIGVLEICLIALYLFPRTSVLGSFLLTGFVGGAIVTHIIARESFAPPLAIGFLMFAGAYLRHPGLRKLVPFQESSAVPDKVSKRAIAILG
jgi:hypothetical protein